MSDWAVVPALALAIVLLAAKNLVWAVAFFRLRRRHRACRHELVRVQRHNSRLRCHLGSGAAPAHDTPWLESSHQHEGVHHHG